MRALLFRPQTPAALPDTDFRLLNLPSGGIRN